MVHYKISDHIPVALKVDCRIKDTSTTKLDNGPNWNLPQGLSETTWKELISVSFSNE